MRAAPEARALIDRTVPAPAPTYRAWYETQFLSRIGPWALYGPPFTIVILLTLRARPFTSQPCDVARIALPLLAYFALMRRISFTLGYRLGFSYEKNTTVAFTAAGNNFELAIAVANPSPAASDRSSKYRISRTRLRRPPGRQMVLFGKGLDNES